MFGFISKKVGMTTIYRENGEAVSVTVLKADPNFVTQIKTVDNDGYNAVQLACEEVKEKTRKEKVNGEMKQIKKAVNKPYDGHFKKANTPVLRHAHEFRMDEIKDVELGQKILCDVFEKDTVIDVIGTSKGKGFAGVMKRHHFAGGMKTHGGMNHRGPGSIGGSSNPSRVWPGMKMGGQMGNVRVTEHNKTIVDVDVENNVILVKGPVPGANDSIVVLRPAKKAR
ncbi:MAG: 50S ribosomal protein L3 [Candidatus Muirbacterium halophilum]|nr:50S ribosomal protein L3 [Candidatus Muirbacterium halophilum]MCK9475256.1 50S ribosomal protein L3 [Candidatus Muirbacterium halophilum]